MIWLHSICEGLIRLHRNKTIIGLTLISVVLGRSMSVLEHAVGRSIPDLLLSSVRLDVLETLRHELMSGAIGSALSQFLRREHLRPVDGKGLWIMVAIGGGAALLAFFNSAGLTAIIRDLLVDHCYSAQRIISHGRHFLVPFLKFKGPIYLFGGFFVFIFGLFLGEGLVTERLLPSSAVLFVVVLGALLFLPYYSFLSIGSKLIVTEPHRGTVELYRRTGAFLVTHAREVSAFYLILVSFFGVTMWTVQEILQSTIPFTVGYGLTVFLIAYVTALGKLSSFIFFLRLRVTDELRGAV